MDIYIAQKVESPSRQIFRKMRDGRGISCKMHRSLFAKLLGSNMFLRGMIPAKEASVKTMEPTWDGATADLKSLRVARTPANIRMMGNLPVIVLTLVLIAGLSVMSTLFRFGDAWQFAAIFPAMLAVLLTILAVEKLRMRNRAALQAKLDQLIHSAETLHNRILDLEKLALAGSTRLGNGFADWSPQRSEDGHTNGRAIGLASAVLDGAQARHHSETAHPGRHQAGAHRITPTAKA